MYEYYRWNVEEGWAELDRIAAQYNNLEQWEKRKQALVPAIIEALQLKNLPAPVTTAPIRTTPRKCKGIYHRKYCHRISSGCMGKWIAL